MSKYLYLVAAVLVTIIITVLSLRESDSIPDVDIPYLDKLFHLIAYFLLTILWVKYASLHFFNKSKFQILTVIILLLLTYGIIIEVLQTKLTDTRMLEISDIVANSLGIAFGILIYNYTTKHKLNSNKGLFF